MRNIRHEYLKKVIDELVSVGFEDAPDETYQKLDEEIKHSCLIAPGTVEGDEFNLMTAMTTGGTLGMLFTDMDEFRKVFPDFQVNAYPHLFVAYQKMMEKSDMAGYILNIRGQPFVLPRDLIIDMEDIPVPDHSAEGAYTSEELKKLRDSIDNSPLEDFIKNPDNTYDYEGLFEVISSSTLFTLMLSKMDLKDWEVDGMIALDEKHPAGVLFIEEQAGKYATAYTSEEKIAKVEVLTQKYSQIIDFSYMVNFALYDDLDGIIINPRTDNIILTRDVLLEFSALLNKTCRNPKLNTATLYMFSMEA